MCKSDWIDVGLRLLGVYFIVTGAVALWRTLLVLIIAARATGDASLGGGALLIPVAEIGAGVVLLLVRWPGARTSAPAGRPPPLPAHLDSMFDQLESSQEKSPPAR